MTLTLALWITLAALAITSGLFGSGETGVAE